jgi:ELWxxDGT repeat protein
LYVTNGTPGGTKLVENTSSGNPSDPRNFIQLGSNVFFSGVSGNGAELWKSDGTNGGTVQVKDIYPGFLGSTPLPLGVLGTTILFKATDGVSGNELWKTDGTTAGTVMVKDIFPGPDGSIESDFGSTAILDGYLYFQADFGKDGW